MIGGAAIEKEPLPQRLSELRSDFDLRDSRVQAMVRDLARKVNQGINACATASDTALLASVVLSGTFAHSGGVTLTQAVCLQRIASLRQMIGKLGVLLDGQFPQAKLSGTASGKRLRSSQTHQIMSLSQMKQKNVQSI